MQDFYTHSYTNEIQYPIVHCYKTYFNFVYKQYTRNNNFEGKMHGKDSTQTS